MRSARLKRAEKALETSWDTTLASSYLLSYPDELTTNGRLDDLIMAVATPSLRRAKDIYSGKPFLLRRELNGPVIDGSDQDGKQERERLAAALTECSGYNAVADDLSDALMDEGGPLAMRALSYTGLKAQLANYFGATGQVKFLLEDYLSWRLLAQAESEARALADTLAVADSSHPAVGDAGGRLHYIVGREFAACDLEMSLGRAERGSWRDQKDDRCPTCEKMLPSLIEPGSDDPDHYTLLNKEQYQAGRDRMRQLIQDSRARFQAGSDSDNLVKWTLEKAEGEALALAGDHRQEIASLFAEQFNDLSGQFRRPYLEDFAGKRFLDIYERSLSKTGEPYIEGSEVVAWLSGWMDEKFYLTAHQVAQNVENNIRHWLDGQKTIVDELNQSAP